MPYFVYILECCDGTYYTGKTTDPDKRLKQHNGLIKNGAKYTRSRRPVKIRYIEQFETSGEALKKEYILKQLTREQKINLVNNNKNVIPLCFKNTNKYNT